MKLKFRHKIPLPTGGKINVSENGATSVTHKVGPVTITNSPTETRVTLRLGFGVYITERVKHKK